MTDFGQIDSVFGMDIVEERVIAKDLGISRRTLARMHVERCGPPASGYHEKFSTAVRRCGNGFSRGRSSSRVLRIADNNLTAAVK